MCPAQRGDPRYGSEAIPCRRIRRALRLIIGQRKESTDRKTSLNTTRWGQLAVAV